MGDSNLPLERTQKRQQFKLCLPEADDLFWLTWYVNSEKKKKKKRKENKTKKQNYLVSSFKHQFD
jgi:hypothetical protein